MALSLKQTIGVSEFCGAAIKAAQAPTAAKKVSFTVRAGGYEEELVKTAVSVNLESVTDLDSGLRITG